MRIAAVRLSPSGNRWLTFDDPVHPNSIGTIVLRPRRKPSKRVNRKAIEAMAAARRKIPVEDYQAIADEYTVTDISMEELGARYGASRERIRQIIKDVDPSIPRRRKARRLREQAEREAAEAWVKFWKRCRIALAENRRCKACDGWIIRDGKGVTCSTDCAEAYPTLRIFDDPDYHRRAMAKVYLSSPEKYKESHLEWARRMDGPNPPMPNRNYLVPGSHRAEVIKKYRPEAYAELMSA